MRKLLVLLLAVRPAWAVEPGTTVGADRVAELGDLVLPGTIEAVKRGMRIEVVEGRAVRWRRAYAEATEKYASQVGLGPATPAAIPPSGARRAATSRPATSGRSARSTSSRRPP